MKKGNIFWGLLFLCAGALVVIGQAGFMEVNLFRILFSTLLIVIALTNLPRRRFGGFVVPVMLVVWINRGLLGLTPYVSIWGLAGAAILITIGLSLLFRPRWENQKNYYDERRGRDRHREAHTESSQADDDVRCNVSFSSSSQYLYSKNLERVSLRCSFGNLQVYFDQSMPSVEGVDVDVDCSFANVELYIPRDWDVRNGVSATLGSADEENKRFRTDGGPIIRLQGHASFGSVKIIYI